MPNSIYTYQSIDPTECMGDSLFKINNNNFNAEKAIGILETRLNSLSSSMRQINNVPYTEIAWVCAPNATPQGIAANTITTLHMNTVVSDTESNIVSFEPGLTPPEAAITTNFTLKPGTYYFEGHVPGFNDKFQPLAFISSLYNVTDSIYITKQGQPGGQNNYGSGTTGTQHLAVSKINGQMSFTTNKTFIMRILTDTACGIRNGGSVLSDSTPNADQRTTIKLWKVG